MGSNSVKQFPSGRLNRSNGGVFPGQTEHSGRESGSKPHSGSQQTEGRSRAFSHQMAEAWPPPGCQGQGPNPWGSKDGSKGTRRGCGEKGTLQYCWQLWKFLKKTKNRVTIWPSNPTPGHILRENCNSKRYMYLNVHSSTIYNSQDYCKKQVRSNLTVHW